MLQATAEQWIFEDEPEEAAPKKRGKPICRKLPYAVIDDPRLSYRLRCFLGWRASHDPVKWRSNKIKFKEDTGAGKDCFHPCIKEAKDRGYLERTQASARRGEKYQCALEKLNLKAAPPSKRRGYLPISNEDLKLVIFREIGVFYYLRSHSPKYVQSASHIASKVLLHPNTVRSICNALVGKGLVARIKRQDKKSGRFTDNGYAALPWKPGDPWAAKPPCNKMPDTGNAGYRKTRTHNIEHLGTPLRETPWNSSSADEEKALPRRGATALFSGEGEGGKKSSTYAERKAARERRDIANLFKSTGVEVPFDEPATIEEAIKHVNSVLAWKANTKANAGVEIDGDTLADLQFEDIGPPETAETLCIADKTLRQGIRKAAGGKMKRELLGSEGLLSVRRMIARLMQEDMTAAEAFAFLLAEIEKATTRKWLNGWQLISKPLGGRLRMGGIERMTLADDNGQSLPEKFRAADDNGVLAPHLFSERGLAGLRKLIADHGAETVNEAVSEYLWRSKIDREIPRLHVRAWAYFGKIITGQAEIEGEHLERL